MSKKSLLWTLAGIFVVASGLACTQQRGGGQVQVAAAMADPRPEEKDDGNTLIINFTYGSEKEEWIKEVTKTFNSQNNRQGGKRIKVNAVPMGSGECIDEILDGKQRVHIVSPASNAFIVLGNDQSKQKTGKPLVGKTKNLVLSPVVIGMWKPMAEKLGWPNKVGWADIKKLAEDKDGWGSLDRPQWGSFKFGHTHPDFSNSGLISVLAEVYAGAGKTEDLTVDDVNKSADFLKAIEKSVVHYGSSTGFFSKKMFSNGPEYLSAAVMYENMVIESYDNKKYKNLAFPVVAVYPSEGTFWSDHPIGIVQRDYNDDNHQQAAQKYIDFLMEEKQQKTAMKTGFRPGLESIPVDSPIDSDHGVNPKEPAKELQTPKAEVIREAVKLWKTNKKPAQVVIVMDTSGSMRLEGRMTNAKAGAKQLISMLADQDEVSLLSFSDKPTWVIKDSLNVGKDKAKIIDQIDALIPAGETALYDAVQDAYKYLSSNSKPGYATALVVLTDGEDNKSGQGLNNLVQGVKIDLEKRPIRIFTIAYGSDAKEDVLKKISDATEAKTYKGTPENIKAIFMDIGTFF
jgi:Ca-activated chloride channel homolog